MTINNDRPLHIDGKLVTEANAWRFVKARRPHAEVHRERTHGWHASNYSVVRDRTEGAPWCNATGKTAGEAWLKAARQMIAYDAKIAAEKQALEAAMSALTAAKMPEALATAALRYAAERLSQNDTLYSVARRHAVDTLLEMAGTPTTKE